MNTKVLRILPISVALASAVAAAACSGSTEAVTGQDMPLVGVISAAGPDALFVVDVHADGSAGIVYEGVGVNITQETEIFVREPDGSLREAGADELAAGDAARFWTTGVEIRTLPPQVYATRIEALRDR